MKITRIDHIRVYVDDIPKAEHWYKEVLGFSRDSSLYFWFEQGGPLVIKNSGAALSLFLRKSHHPGHIMAFDVGASSFSELIPILRDNVIPYTISDHEVSMPVYFSDLYDNKIEVTSYDYIDAKRILDSLV